MGIRKERFFNSVRAESLSSRIVDQVLEALFSKQLRAGQFLGTEAQLSKMFATSRMPVREALSQLEALGVLYVKTGASGGATIAPGEPDQFATALAVQFALIEATTEEIFDARIAIETRAAELAASKADAASIGELHQLLDKIKERRAEGRDAVEEILDFHVAIVGASNSRTLISLMRGLRQPIVSLYTRSEAQLAGRGTKYVGLGQILSSIEKGDAPAAHSLMHDHLVAQRNWIVKQLAAADEEAEHDQA